MVLSAQERLDLARHKERPCISDYIKNIFTDFFELHGDRLYGDDCAICGGIARFKGQPVTVIGHAKGKNTKENIKVNFGMPHPEGYRKAMRLMRQAEKFSRPVISFINTPGAYCGVGAEERGQGEAIARNLLEMMSLRTPVISVITGEGFSGGALALGVANEILMLENSIYSVISTKGLASILWKDPSREKEAAEIMKITAKDLKNFGIIDKIIPEPEGGAHKNLDMTYREVSSALVKSLERLSAMTPDEIYEHRFAKYREIGVYSEIL